jgi:hypothetical protein
MSFGLFVFKYKYISSHPKRRVLVEFENTIDLMKRTLFVPKENEVNRSVRQQMHKDVYRNNDRKLPLDILVVLLKIILKIDIREMWHL